MHWPLTRVAVAERSMEPALRPGDWLLVRRTRRIRAGQIVLARHPGPPDPLIVERAARPVDGGGWLESDTRDAGAVDSRRFGPVPADLIEGRVLVRYWPRRPLFLGRTGGVPAPAHENPAARREDGTTGLASSPGSVVQPGVRQFLDSALRGHPLQHLLPRQ